MLSRILIVAALAAAPVVAQAPPAQRITFDDAVRLALTQNIAVRQAQNTAMVASDAVSQAKENFLPDLRINASGTETVDRGTSGLAGANASGLGAGAMSTQAVSSGLSSSVTLFDGGRNLASLRSAQASQTADGADLTRAKQTAVFTVAQDYVALSTKQEDLAVQRENLASQQSQLDEIQKFVSAGTRPISDLYQQKANVASAQLAVTTANQAVELAKVDVMQALQLDAAGNYEFVAPAMRATSVTPTASLDSLLALAYRNRPDLAAQTDRLDAANQDAKAAAAARLPTVTVTGNYNTGYNSALDPGLATQLNQRQGASLAVGVSLPLFDKGSAKLAAQRAAADEENARLAVLNQRQQVALDVRRAYLNQQAAAQQLTAAQAQDDAATQAVDATQKRYDVGAATLVELTQVRAQQVQAANALASARYNLVLQQAMIGYYTGALDPQHVTLGS